MSSRIDRLRRTKRKAIYELLDTDTAMDAIFSCEHAYILGEAYLVVYDIGTPWYAPDGVLLLFEKLVLRLAVGGDTDFSVVPDFLAERAQEAGCRLVLAGTALAPSDAALASLYSRCGYQAASITLTKDP